MKNLLLTTISVLSISLSVNAQRKVAVLPDNNGNAFAHKTKCIIKSSASAYSSAEPNINIKAWIEDEPQKGPTLKFESSKTIGKVDIIFEQPKQATSTTSYPGTGTNTGFFYLNSPAYRGAGLYLFRFYMPGDGKSPVWIVMVERQTESIKQIKESYKITK